MKNTENRTFCTDYNTAARWNTDLVLCNNIVKADPSVIENMRFNCFECTCPDCSGEDIKEDDDGMWNCPDCGESFNCVNEDPLEIYQWYITDLTESGVEYMEKTFNLHYTYSDLLDCFILCVMHFGTAWSYIPCQVKSEGWIQANKDKEYTKG